ncbi:probable E3 ubiquitin-protein ligase HERC6 isoform X2 [Hemicordylus capensis]|uniref:probable E3 ubiquitin-protein ligase HERC6 isoform X2 n=1 Tax=Hemicordylus capensis TaxID=884348 RepID=UPI002302D8C0|nr:probable E3 ubiquitin-protein ligase HERC6 isoform X2 [Hemicordylus capensis]
MQPIQIQGAQNIVHVSCGKEHSLAICNNGKVFSWGAGTFGQLGTGELRERIIPKKIDGLSTLKVIQVACGNYHSIALAKDGRVFSWGQNTHGQLGLGKEVSSRATPQHVPALDGIPLAQVSAGGAHSFALSLSGVAYGWGRNHAHQLGLSPTPTREQVFKPMSVAALRSLDVTYISCGDEHTAVLTENGSIFTFGDDSAGQLGHSSSAQKTGPQKVDWIDGPVSQLACGSYHTLVLSASGQLISFGRGPLQRYGSGTSPSKPYNTQSFNISSLISPNELSSVQVKCIFAGTYVSFASMCPSQTPTCANRTVSCVESLLKISQVDRVLIDKWMSAGAESEMRQTAKREIEAIFSSPSCLTASFLKPRSALELGCCIAVDLQKAGEVFKELTQKDWIAGRVCYSLLNHLIPALPLNSPHQEALSSFLLLPECSAALEAQNLKSLAMPFAKAISSMSKRSLEILEKYWLLLPDSTFDRVVQMLKRAVISQLPYYLAHPHCLEVVPVLEVLKKLYKVNKKANYKLQISNFYINEILKKVGLEDLRRWYIWIEKSLPVPEDKYPVSFCRFPFVFDPQSKMWIFYWSSHFQQEANARQALLSNRLQSSGEAPKLPVFLLRVQRHNLVESTLRKLSRVEDSCLRCQLMVEFEGEMARHEAGGVLLEFFWYLFEEMTHPEYGMFMYCEHNSPMWFPAKPSVEMNKYFLFGLLCGLFLFNRVFVYVPFPLAAFKKLTGQKPSLDDLKELSPVLGKSLQAVLDYEHDDIEEKLQLCYSISWDNLDIDLIPNGSSVAVNNTNKKDFVNKYVDYILNKSVNGVFEEFKRGFYKVLDKRIVGFFEPQELMEVAIGNEKYDWDKLEKNTVYWGVYSAEHPTIKMFWEVFHELTLDDKKGFLLFVRGSDRIPVTGMDSEKITIHSHRLLTEDHIPEAQTCFSILFLPPYSTKGKLKEKFLQAIENNRGFGKQ